MDSLNVKNINDEKIFNVIDPNGQGEVVNRIRPISISINQKAETINDETDSTVNLSVYWNDTWKSILDLTFNDSLRQEYGKLVTDLTAIQKDIDMKQYKDAETKTADFLKYVANLSSKYTAIPEKSVVSKIKNDFVKIKADKNSVKVAISDKLLNFMLKKYAKVDNLDYTKSNECFSTSKFNCLANNYDIYYHSPEIFQKQAYMTVVKDNKVVGSYKVNYDQFSKFASKFMLTPQKLGYSKDRLAGYMKTAEVVMQNIFFDSVDEAKEWQEMVDEKKKEQATTPEGEEETTETTTTETKTEMGEGKSESPVKGDGGLARPSEDFASDEIPESEPRQQEQQGGGQNLGASRRVKNVKKVAGKRLWVEVIYGKGKDDYWVTDMNPNVTDEEVRKYFTGHSFNIDHGFDEKGQPIEKFVRPYEVIIHREEDKQASKKVKLNKKAENRKNYNVVIGFDGKEEESDFAQEDVISALQEALIYFGEKWHELPSSLDNIDKLDFVKIREIEKGETVKEYTKEDILKMKEDFPKYSCNKKAIYGDVQEQDIVPAKTETKVYLQSEDKGNKKQLPNFSVTVRRNSDDEVVDIIECNNQKEAEETYKYMLSDLDKDCYVSINKLVGKEEYTEIKNSSLNKEESCKKANKNKLVNKKAEEQTIEEKIEEAETSDIVKGKIGVGDIVTVCIDKLEYPEEAFKYTELIGEPLILMDNDKENIDKVIVEQTEYPYQRMTVNKDEIALYDEVKDEQVIVEDEDGDEIITELAEVPIVAKNCKIKSIHKKAKINKKAEKDERQFWFEDMDLIIDGKEEKCKGFIGIDVDTEIVEGVLPDGETSTGETGLQVNDFKLLWLPDLAIENEPTREFTDEERDKIFKDNFERFARIFDKEFIETEINEIPNEYKEWN